MMTLEVKEIVQRLLLCLLFSGLIGFEREKNHSNAGLKTHILVGIGSAIVALIQVESMNSVINLNLQSAYDKLPVSVDGVRLIAQVVSGIGFLGAGTIIVTKRNVLGLTTAASIWTVASIGLAFGMGFYRTAIIGSSFVVGALFVFKKVLNIHATDMLVIKYIYSMNSLSKIVRALEELNIKYDTVRYSSETFGHELVVTHVFKIDSIKKGDFTSILEALLKTEVVVSVEKTNIG